MNPALHVGSTTTATPLPARPPTTAPAAAPVMGSRFASFGTQWGHHDWLELNRLFAFAQVLVAAKYAAQGNETEMPVRVTCMAM